MLKILWVGGRYRVSGGFWPVHAFANVLMMSSFFNIPPTIFQAEWLIVIRFSPQYSHLRQDGRRHFREFWRQSSLIQYIQGFIQYIQFHLIHSEFHSIYSRFIQYIQFHSIYSAFHAIFSRFIQYIQSFIQYIQSFIPYIQGSFHMDTTWIISWTSP